MKFAPANLLRTCFMTRIRETDYLMDIDLEPLQKEWSSFAKSLSTNICIDVVHERSMLCDVEIEHEDGSVETFHNVRFTVLAPVL